MGDLDHLLYPVLGLPPTDLSRSAGDLPPPYACRDDGTPKVPDQLPPPSALGGEVVGTWSSQTTGPAAVASPENRLLMIVGACLPAHDREFISGGRNEVFSPSMTVSVTRKDGKPAAEAEITCSGSLGEGLVLPEIGGPFHITASGASSWEVPRVRHPRVEVSRTGDSSVP